MSWQAYVDNLMGAKHMTHCGIFGLDGATWAATPNFPLPVDSIRSIVNGISDSGKLANGVSVGGERHILVKGDPGVFVILKKGPNGIVAYKSSQSVVVGLHDGSAKAEQALNDIGKVVDYLSKHGY